MGYALIIEHNSLDNTSYNYTSWFNTILADLEKLEIYSKYWPLKSRHVASFR